MPKHYCRAAKRVNRPFFRLSTDHWKILNHYCRAAKREQFGASSLSGNSLVAPSLAPPIWLTLMTLIAPPLTSMDLTLLRFTLLYFDFLYFTVLTCFAYLLNLLSLVSWPFYFLTLLSAFVSSFPLSYFTYFAFFASLTLRTSPCTLLSTSLTLPFCFANFLRVR